MSKDTIKPTRVFIGVNENPVYYQYWPLVGTAWRSLGFEPVLSLCTNKDKNSWKWMEDYGTIKQFPEHHKIPSGNWAKLTRWWLTFQSEEEIGFISDMDMLPLQKEYFLELPEEYDPDNHFLLKGTNDNSLTGKSPANYMTAKGSVWKNLLNPGNKHNDIFNWISQYEGQQLYDVKEDPLLPHNRFSDESWIRSIFLQWNPDTDKILRTPRPGGFQHGILSTSLRVDRSMWPATKETWEQMGFMQDKKYPDNCARPLHPAPHENFYIDAHLPHLPLNKSKEHIVPLLSYMNLDESLLDLGFQKAAEMIGE